MSVVSKCLYFVTGASLFGVVLSGAACAQAAVAPSSAGNSAVAMTTGVWQLQSMTRPDSGSVTVADPARFTLEFVDTRRLAARSDCNRAAGSYSMNGSTLSVGPMATTQAYCSSAPFDSQYLDLLGGDNQTAVTAASLVLSSPRGTLQFSR
jgi:heat shock protein HslJ